MSEEMKVELDGKEIAKTITTDESLNTAEQMEQEDKREGGEDKRIPYERFKQKVDEANALKEKLAEIEREQAEAEKAELEAQNKYKELYEQALQEKEQARQEALELRKTSLLKSEGYDDEQAKLLVKLIDGDDEDAIAESIKQIKATVPITDNYADPSTFNGRAAKPKTVDAEELGRNAVSRVLHKIKL